MDTVCCSVTVSVSSLIRSAGTTFFSTTGTSFRTVGLVEFPVKGTWSIVFISNPANDAVQESLPEQEEEHIGVFLPCTPNPTTGFFFYLPRRNVIELPMSVDDAAKLVMSAGVIQPDDAQRRLQKLAEAARSPAPGPELETT